MSADNGIYILKTKDSYRVIHAQAIDNLYWSFEKFSQTDNLVPTRLVEYFGKTKFTRNKEKAWEIASNIAERQSILEYGVSQISTNKSWRTIVNEAKQIAEKEIEAIKNHPRNDGRYDYDLKVLEEIIVG